ncbi:MAG TPA: AAA family ATPase, partial [Nocardioides sp.]|nr:AAA family ATPase [Nocardioides sp.]
LVAAGALDRSVVEERLTAAALAAGLEVGETRGTLASGLAAGMAQPREIPERQVQVAEVAQVVDVARTDDGLLLIEDLGRTLSLTAASGIRPRPVHWLWKHRLALGTLGLLAGREGLGKSTLAYTLAALLSRGELFGARLGTPRGTLVCATEDSWEHTIVPRLLAADADLDRIWRAEVVTADDIHVGLSLPRDLHAIEQAAAQTEASLLLLDPLMSRLGDLDTHRDAEVRRALEPLVALAHHADLAVLGLIHHNKSGSTDPLQLVMGSKAFTAVARSVHTVVPDPDDESGRRRLFGTPKNNLGRTDLPTFSFTIEGAEIDTDEGPATTGRLCWGAESSAPISELLRRGSMEEEERTVVGEAAEWLGEWLEDHGGADDRRAIMAAARAAGHTVAAVKRARYRLGVTFETCGFPARSVWSLPGTTAQSAHSRPIGETT